MVVDGQLTVDVRGLFVLIHYNDNITYKLLPSNAIRVFKLSVFRNIAQ